jgi:Spy/CpxP family protein refolding chaperone
MNSRSRAIASLAAVFLLGCLCGAGGLNLWIKQNGWSHQSQPEMRRGGRPNSIFEQLKLSPEQQAKLKTILDESRNQIDALRSETGPKFDAVRAQTNLKISAILTEEQRKKFEQSTKEMEKRREPPFGRGGFGPRMPPPESR